MPFEVPQKGARSAVLHKQKGKRLPSEQRPTTRTRPKSDHELFDCDNFRKCY